MITTNQTQAAAIFGTPTAKATEYADFCRAQLRNTRLKPRQREELEEDLYKLEEKAHYLEINGVRHFYLDEGPANGVPIVFVHGWDCTSWWWHTVTDALNRAGYRTINYDYRGHGFTDDPADGDYTIPTLARDLDELTRKLGLQRFHLFAFSVGALVAAAFAAQNPARVASVAFFNFGLFEHHPVLEKLGPRSLSFVFSRLLKRVKWWQPVYAYVRLTLVKNPVSRRDILIGMRSLHNTSPAAAYGAARSTMSKDVLGQLPNWAQKLTMPVLMVAGSHDKVISQKSAQKLARLLPNGTFFLMPHCGHLILGELPDQVITLLKMHIERSDLNLKTGAKYQNLN